MKQSLQFHIGAGEAGQRLDHFLAGRVGWLSRMRISALLAEGACVVNRERGVPGYHLIEGDRVEFELEETEPTAMTPESIPLNIVYEDAHLLVLDKPAGMLVHPTRGEKTGTLANALSYYLNYGRSKDTHAPVSETAMYNDQNAPSMIRPGLVHRLDRATSGLMVVAKHQRALTILTRHFHHRLVEKRYLALLHGLIKDDEMVIEAPIGRDAEAHPKWRVLAEGKHAETRLRVLKRREGLTLVELEPVTGRTNQLRIHCAHAGHAIVGDTWYGPQDAAARLCLHAAELRFHHPVGGDWLEFTSDIDSLFHLFIGSLKR